MHVIVINIDVNVLASSVIHMVSIIPDYTFNLYVVDINLNINNFSSNYHEYSIRKYIICFSNNPSIGIGNLPWHTQIDKNNYIIPAYLFQLTLSVIPDDLSNST